MQLRSKLLITPKRFFIPLPFSPASRESVVTQKKILPYRPKELYDIVADVGKYHEFIPLCTSSVVLSSRVELINNGSMEKRIREMSELGIGINGMDVKYTSKVTREERINGKELYRILANVDNDDIFHHLRTEWMFKPFLNAEHDRKCLVEFDVRFKFKSPILAQLATTMLEESNKLILDAFERRAREIYQ